MKIIFFGDVFGKPGRLALNAFLPAFKYKNKIDLAIANCENLADGKGVTERSATELFTTGVDIASSGNHLWDRREGLEYISKENRIAKPMNYPKATPGFEYVLKKVKDTEIMLLSLCGQGFMNSVDSPFHSLDNFLSSFENLPKCVIVDFHAESTAEKRTFGFYFDGRVSAVLGTHTHIQTADEEILENGTAYITDVGMCGPHDSVIGVKKEIAIERAKTSMPVRHTTADQGLQVNAVLLEIDDFSGKAISIKRIREKL